MIRKLLGSLSCAAMAGFACYRAEPSPVADPPDAHAEPVSEENATYTLRLTRDEYDRTVVDLFGFSSEIARPSDGFPEDDRSGGLPYGTAVTALHVEKERAAAERVADRVLDSVIPLCNGLDDATCVDALLGDDGPPRALGARAFRRPLTIAEKNDLFEVFRAGLATGDRREGIRAVLEALLFAPQFLLKESTARAQKSSPDGYTLASRISYFLTGSLPDNSLFVAAATGRLATVEGRRSEALRLIDSPQGRRYLPELYRQLFRSNRIEAIARDTTFYPGFSPVVAGDLGRGFESFLQEAIVGTAPHPSGTLDTLFRGDQSYFTATTAAFYGVPGLFNEIPAPVSFEISSREGVLTQPGFLALQSRFDGSDPIHRGVFVRRQILCGELSDPPPNIPVKIPSASAGSSKTTRERFAQHTDPSQPGCYSCHQDIDPLGFAFEAFDGVGRFRTHENGWPIDASGAITHTAHSDGPVQNAHELADRLAASEDVAHCLARHTWLWALRRPREAKDDARIDNASFPAALRKGIAGEPPGFRALALAIVTSDLFAATNAEAP